MKRHRAYFPLLLICVSFMFVQASGATGTPEEPDKTIKLKPDYYQVKCRELTDDGGGGTWLYKLFVPESEIDKEAIKTSEDIIVFLFPIYKRTGLDGFYGYLGAVSCEKRSDNCVVIGDRQAENDTDNNQEEKYKYYDYLIVLCQDMGNTLLSGER